MKVGAMVKIGSMYYTILGQDSDGNYWVTFAARDEAKTWNREYSTPFMLYYRVLAWGVRVA